MLFLGVRDILPHGTGTCKYRGIWTVIVYSLTCTVKCCRCKGQKKIQALSISPLIMRLQLFLPIILWVDTMLKGNDTFIQCIWTAPGYNLSPLKQLSLDEHFTMECSCRQLCWYWCECLGCLHEKFSTQSSRDLRHRCLCTCSCKFYPWMIVQVFEQLQMQGLLQTLITVLEL